MIKTIKSRIPKPIKFQYRKYKAYIYSFLSLKKNDKLKVLIFAQGRTGSTLLENLICSTGYFRASGELLSPVKGRITFPYRYVDGLTRLKSDANFIFHLKVYHLTRDRKNSIDPNIFLKRLKKDNWKIIYLKRTNLLNHALSNIVAEKRQNYRKFDSIKENITLNLDLNELKNGINERQKFAKQDKLALKDIGSFSLEYEKDLEKSEFHQQSIDSILEYLNLEKRIVRTKHKKVNALTHKELIENYDDFYQLLKDNNWLKYLN